LGAILLSKYKLLKMKLRSIIFTLITLTIFSACGETQKPTEEAQDMNEKKIESLQLEADAEFFVDYKHGLLLSSQMADLAIEKSTDERIKKFAKTVLADVTVLNNKIEKATSSYDMVLPVEISEKAKMKVDKFKSMSDTEFDEAYLKWVMESNKSFMKDSKAVVSTTNKTNSLMEVANAISAQAFAHNAIIDKIQSNS
jgi:putative membrane protein